MEAFNDFREVYSSGKKAPSGAVRFAFTHQLYKTFTAQQVRDFTKVVLGAITNAGQRVTAPVTEQHIERRLGEKGDRVNSIAADAVKCLQPLAGKASVERIFLSMNSLVVVCTILPMHIATAHAAATGWVKAIMAVQNPTPGVVIVRDGE